VVALFLRVEALIYLDKDFFTSEIGFSTFFEKDPKNASFTALKFWKNKISKFITF
jgi:hypothetical protein